MRLQSSQLALQLHELPLISSYLEPGLNVLIAGSTLGQIIDSVNEGRVETIPESETKLEAVQIFGLLNEHPKGINVFIECTLFLTVLVLILQRKSCGCGQIEEKEFCLEIGFKGCPVCEAVYSTWTLEYPEHIS